MLVRFIHIALLLLLQPLQLVFALSHFKLNFTTPIEQCGPAEIQLRRGDFSDGRGDDPTPVSLTILPFNASNLVIPVPGLSSDSDSIHLSFIPLPADMPFVASLSDASGEILGFLSDIISIQPSDSTGCLPVITTPRTYSIPDRISQCDIFKVSYDPSIVTNPPSVKAIAARGPSYDFKEIKSEDGQVEDGAAFYSMNAFRGVQIALSIDDGNGHAETTTLFSVFGDSSSPRSCIDFGNFTFQATDAQKESGGTSSGISTKGLVGIGVGVAVFILSIASIMIVYVVRQRRSRRRAESRLYKELFWAQTGGPERVSTMSLPPQPPMKNTQITSPGFVTNPAYTSHYYEDDEDDDRNRARDSSHHWVYGSNNAEDRVLTSAAMRPGVERRPTNLSSRHFQSPSVTSLDIAQILDTAAGYQGPQSPHDEHEKRSSRSSGQLVTKMDTPVSHMHLASVDHSLDPIPPLAVTPTTPDSVATSVSSRRKQRGPADVPADPASFISNGGMFGPFPGQMLNPNQSHGQGYRISHLSALSNAQSVNAPDLQRPAQAH
jgi:hypothetical protein